MPAREAPNQRGRMFRRFTFGPLADLLMLDTRVTGRDQQASGKDITAIESASRQLLGREQEQWLFDALHESARANRPWQLLGQQVMFAPQTPPGQPAGNPDSWDGYRSARARVFEAAAAARAPHLVVFTGDVHSSWAYDLTQDPFDAAKYDSTTGRPTA
jgi:alkaline phosphatase D